MLYHSLLMIVLVASCHAYKTGPPVKDHPDICASMAPSSAAAPNGHGAAATSNSASPFEVVVSSTCYKSGQQLTVRLRDKSGTNNKIEGLFVQARRVTGDTTTPVGTFQPVNYDKTQLLQCSAANDAVGHMGEPKLTSMDFNWSPPASDVGAVKFRVTIVEHKATYWVGLESPQITYDATCAETTYAPPSAAAHPFLTVPLLIVSALMALMLSV